MSAEEENEFIALKKPSLETGTSQKYCNSESTFNKHIGIIPVGSADVAAFLSKYPGNVVARNWKILLDCYGNEEMDEDLIECEDFSLFCEKQIAFVKCRSGATEDFQRCNSAPRELVEHTICL